MTDPYLNNGLIFFPPGTLAETLAELIKLERANEREECAKVAEEHYNYYGCDFIAAAIRARGEK